MQDLKFLWITVESISGNLAFTQITLTLTLIFKFHAKRQVCLKPAIQKPHTKRQHMTLTFSD